MADAQRKTILVVEDEELLRELLVIGTGGKRV